MQNKNNASLLAQRFLKLALLLQVTDKLGMFNQRVQNEFATIVDDFEPIKERINAATVNATIEGVDLIEIDHTTNLNELFQIDNDAIDSFLSVGLDAQDFMDDILKDLEKGNLDDL